MTASTFDATSSCVGELGFFKSRLHAPSEASDASAAATATARCLVMRMRGLRRSVSEARADRPHARNGIATEIEPAVGRRRLHRTDAAGVGAEQVDLRVVAAVIGPHDQVAARQRELDAV